ncbi:MAG: hypothetical protein AB1486_21970, partial [Planctomycetota bacterium]
MCLSLSRSVGKWVALCVVLTAVPCLGQTTWTGAVSTNWNTAGNWDTGIVPDATTDVIIAPAANQPSTYSANPQSLDLTIQSGATLTLSGGYDLSVAGDLTIDGSLQVTSTTSLITVTGAWTNNGSFSHGSSTVTFSGTAGLGGSSTSVFYYLTIASSTRTVTTAATIAASLVINPGATLDADAALDVNGAVTVSSGATFDTGTSTHKVAGSWTSNAAGATTSGTGTIEFDGDGTVVTGANSIPNMLVSAGSRLVNSSTIAGDVGMTGGAITILYPTTTTVGGDATFTGGTFGSNGGTAILDVAGDFAMGAAAGNLYAGTYIYCAGNWSSTATWNPAGGVVRLDSAAACTASGSLTFFDLQIAEGTKT